MEDNRMFTCKQIYMTFRMPVKKKKKKRKTKKKKKAPLIISN